MAKRIEVSRIPPVVGTLYPPPFDQPCRARERQKLGDAAGLTQYGVNLLRLPPGAWSSQRHWHSRADEFVYVVAGEVVLVSDDGEELLTAGDAAGFKAGDENGHCLRNLTIADALVLEIGGRLADDAGHYTPTSTCWHRPAKSPPCSPAATARPMPKKSAKRRRRIEPACHNGTNRTKIMGFPRETLISAANSLPPTQLEIPLFSSYLAGN